MIASISDAAYMDFFMKYEEKSQIIANYLPDNSRGVRVVSKFIGYIEFKFDNEETNVPADFNIAYIYENGKYLVPVHMWEQGSYQIVYFTVEGKSKGRFLGRRERALFLAGTLPCKAFRMGDNRFCIDLGN